MYFVLGGSVIQILRLSELSSQDAGSTTAERAKTLNYLKSHTRSMMTTALAFAAGNSTQKVHTNKSKTKQNNF